MQCKKKKGLSWRLIYHQDNNTHKATQEWLQNILKLWPCQSPGLSPIENLWQDLKIASHSRSPCNLTELGQIYRKNPGCNSCRRCLLAHKLTWNKWVIQINNKGTLVPLFYICTFYNCKDFCLHCLQLHISKEQKKKCWSHGHGIIVKYTYLWEWW